MFFMTSYLACDINISYDIVYFLRHCMFEHQARTGVGNDPAPPVCQHGLSLSYASFITFMQLSQPECMKHALVLLLTPRTAMATWGPEKIARLRIKLYGTPLKAN
jgi:hypothetical protein